MTNNLGGDVQQLVDGLANPLKAAGRKVVILTDPVRQLQAECKQSLRGASQCFAAAVFYESPGTTNGVWNYTLRGDSQFGYGRINVDDHDNDAQK